jgi:hypothetical protein
LLICSFDWRMIAATKSLFCRNVIVIILFLWIVNVLMRLWGYWHLRELFNKDIWYKLLDSGNENKTRWSLICIWFTKCIWYRYFGLWKWKQGHTGYNMHLIWIGNRNEAYWLIGSNNDWLSGANMANIYHLETSWVEILFIYKCTRIINFLMLSWGKGSL